MGVGVLSPTTSETGRENNKAVNIPDDILGNIEFMEDISPEATEQMNEIWNAFKQS